MSLTTEDIQQIRDVVYDVLSPVQSEIRALRNDMKEIYGMIADLSGRSILDADFRKLTLEEKLLTLNSELLSAAKHAGIKLPR